MQKSSPIYFLQISNLVTKVQESEKYMVEVRQQFTQSQTDLQSSQVRRPYCLFCMVKQLWVSGLRNGFAHHRSRGQDAVGTVHFLRGLTDYHHNSIIKMSVRLYVWKVGEGFPNRVGLKTLKWAVVYSSVTFNING